MINKLIDLFSNFTWYKLTALIGVIIRLFFLPNPFELLNTYLFLPDIVWRIILFIVDCIIITPFLYWLTFGTVGLMYTAGSLPVWGSILYTIFYSCYVLIIYLTIYSVLLFTTMLWIFGAILVIAFVLSRVFNNIF